MYPLGWMVALFSCAALLGGWSVGDVYCLVRRNLRWA
jgi:hypothetical protein